MEIARGDFLLGTMAVFELRGVTAGELCRPEDVTVLLVRLRGIVRLMVCGGPGRRHLDRCESSTVMRLCLPVFG